MKTRFRQRSSRKKKLRTISIVGVLCICAVLLFSGFFGSLTTLISAPLYGIERWFSESGSTIPVFFRTKAELNTTIEDLNKALSEAELDARRVPVLEEENQRLRALFDDADPERILAGVLKSPNFTPYDTLLVDKGYRDDVIDGAVVYAWDHVPVGVIVRSYPNSALVQLFTAPGFESMTYMFGPDTLAKAEGRGGGVLRVDLPQGLEVAVGDRTILPAVSPNIFGEVSFIERTESDPVQFAYVTQEESVNSLRFVAIDRFAQSDISFEEAVEVIETASSTINITDIPKSVIFDISTSTEEIIEEE